MKNIVAEKTLKTKEEEKKVENLKDLVVKKNEDKKDLKKEVKE